MRSYLVVVLVVAATPAHAQTPDPGALIDQVAASAPGVRRFAKSAFRRARRAISFGPTVGAFGGVASGDDGTASEGAVTFGLGLELFKVPVVPGPDRLKEIAIERAKAKLLARQVSVADGQRLAREVWDQAVGEVLGDIEYNTIERPRLTIALEVDRLLNDEYWALRLRAGLGIWKFTLAGSASVGFDNDLRTYTGLELVTHFMVAKRPRSSVVDVFFRADFEFRAGNTSGVDLYVFGARYLLDVL